MTSLEQERMDMGRIKEIYSEALERLMTGAMPIVVHIKKEEARRLSSQIIQTNIDKIESGIMIYIYAIESGISPSSYLANLYSVASEKPEMIADCNIIRHYELPSILGKAHKIETQSTTF